MHACMIAHRLPSPKMLGFRSGQRCSRTACCRVVKTRLAPLGPRAACMQDLVRKAGSLRCRLGFDNLHARAGQERFQSSPGRQALWELQAG